MSMNKYILYISKQDPVSMEAFHYTKHRGETSICLSTSRYKSPAFPVLQFVPPNRYLAGAKIVYIDIDSYLIGCSIEHPCKILLDKIVPECQKKVILTGEAVKYPRFKYIYSLEPGTFFSDSSERIPLLYPKSKVTTGIDKVALLGSKTLLDIAKKIGPDIEPSPDLKDILRYSWVVTDYSFNNFWGCQRENVLRLPQGEVQQIRWLNQHLLK